DHCQCDSNGGEQECTPDVFKKPTQAGFQLIRVHSAHVECLKPGNQSGERGDDSQPGKNSGKMLVELSVQIAIYDEFGIEERLSRDCSPHGNHLLLGPCGRELLM